MFCLVSVALAIARRARVPVILAPRGARAAARGCTPPAQRDPKGLRKEEVVRLFSNVEEVRHKC